MSDKVKCPKCGSKIIYSIGIIRNDKNYECGECGHVFAKTDEDEE